MAPELIVRRQTWPGGAGTHTGHKASTGKKTPGGVGTHTGHKRARARAHADTRITQTNLTAILTTLPHDHASTGTVPVSVCGHHTPLCIHNSGRGKCSLVKQASTQAKRSNGRPAAERVFQLSCCGERSGSEHTHVVPSCAGRCAGTQTAELRAPTPSDHPRSSNKNIAYSSVSQHTNYVPMFTRMCHTRSHRNSLKNTTMSRLHKL